ncbi:MAG: lytic transglycosylase domain-containing protein [Nisaea sp.]|uniref:lytic transglycosylase domain-containing protein n=1 Tax=Nisaea sp. TaxID=2024842 RepID=UPI001B2725ED|nr:lytic transglycosylase domain-containing protein [Nisaea sp.]MBO6561664.1 lytic transglycosylase domain-containing protein [Nisaea sp.]
MMRGEKPTPPRRGWLAIRVFAAAILGLATGISIVYGPAHAAARNDAIPPRASSYDVLESESVAPQIRFEVIGDEDVARYRKIFELQDAGKWRAADKLIAELDDEILMGHVLYQRYMHPTAYRSKYKELKDWMAAYADHPGARKVYRLALRRKPGNWKPPARPEKGYLTGSGASQVNGAVEPQQHLSRKGPTVSRHGRSVIREIRRFVRQGYPTGGVKYLNSKAGKGLDKTDRAHALAEIAHGYFVFNVDEKAIRYAKESLELSGDLIPTAHWTAGLAYWRQGDYDAASGHFESLARAPDVSRWVKAAGAYWASRAHLAERRPRQATLWLAQAATHSATFYGLLARRALGIDMPLDWTLPELNEDTKEALLGAPGGRRTFALMQVGRMDLAEKELRRLYPNMPDYMHGAIMTVAAGNGMPGLAMRIAGILRARGDRPYYAAFYPLPDWQLDSIAGIDKALIYAIARQESKFNANARSGRGAIGVMQIMPRTAAWVAGDHSFRSRDGRKALMDPNLNLKLGQEYVGHLLKQDSVNEGLFQLLAAYNAGPGTLRKWTKDVDFKQDPLLFIESIPRHETREFIERVLTNLWMYRLRLGQPAPSLDHIAAGSWPRYESIDLSEQPGDPKHARN